MAKNIKTKFVIGFILLLLIIFLIWWFLFRVDSNKMVRKYLSSVYPLTKWSDIPNEDINNLYDSLGFVYNPCSEYQKDDLTTINDNPNDKDTESYGKKVCGSKWSALKACKDMAPQRPPKGKLLSFNAYNSSNQTTIDSDGTGNMKDITSYRQTLHWGVSSNGGEISRTCRSGPGPYWITPFSIVRDFYYPNGIKFKDGIWSIKCNMSNDILNHGCEWNKPKDWTNGYKEGEYIEVTHAQNNPGMPQSVGCWFNGFPGGGTGLFLKIGKTHVANNKIDALFSLISLLKTKTVLELKDSMKNTKFTGKTGSEILKIYYDTDDPYDITWGYANGEWVSMSFADDGKTSLVNPSDSAWKWVGNKGVLNASGLMNSAKISTSIKDGSGYGPNMTVKFSDIAKWWLLQKKLSTELTYDNKKLIIDAARNPVTDIDYFPNRAGGMLSPDEPNCWLGFVLGIETIQMPMSANDNGLWVYEIIDLRIPTSDNTPGFPTGYTTWLDKAKERTYQWITTDEKGSLVWLKDGQGWWMNHLEKLLSNRDPMNIKNGYKCENIGYFDNLTKEQCKNPFDNVPDVSGFDSNGYYDEDNLCWVAVDKIGWQNLPCIKDTLQQQYVKIPLMYPGDNTQFSDSKFFLQNIKEQNPRLKEIIY
jgi:hypothetical protein